MPKLPARREFLRLLGNVAAVLAFSAVLTPLENLYHSWAYRRRLASTKKLLGTLISSGLRSVEVVATGPNAYLSPLPSTQWPELLRLVDQLSPYSSVQRAPTTSGTLQLFLFPTDPHLPQPIRLTWLDDPSLQPQSVVYIGEPCEAAFLDATMAPWLKSFLEPPRVTARAT